MQSVLHRFEELKLKFLMLNVRRYKKIKAKRIGIPSNTEYFTAMKISIDHFIDFSQRFFRSF